MGKYFGTDGVRGIANVKLTAAIAYRIGRYIGQYPNGKKNRILIGRDTRLSGYMLDASLISGITASGSDVYELGVTTTPSISYLVEKYGYDFGVMISASHNPFFDNGIKIFAPTGEKLSNDIELLIEDYIDALKDDLPTLPNEGIGKVVDVKDQLEEYLDFLASKATCDLSSLKVIIDCARGSSSATARKLFEERLHMTCDFICDTYNGLDINDNCGSTHLGLLKEKVKQGDYDLGLAFDGDADRLMLVDKDGNEVDGDAVIYLSALYLKEKGELNDNKVVITVMSNLGLKKALHANNIDFDEVSVGDKYVQARLKEKNLVLGGEQSGHIIFNTDLNTGDGQLTAVHVLNVIAEKKVPLHDLVKDLKIFPQVLKNVGVSNKEAVISHQGLKDRIKELEAKLNGDGRILVRPSGTEQLVRVMVEAKDIPTCNMIADELCQYIMNIAY